MEKVSKFGLTEAIILAILTTELSRDKEFTFGQTGLDIKVNGSKMKWRDMDISTGQTAGCLKVNSRME